MLGGQPAAFLCSVLPTHTFQGCFSVSLQCHAQPCAGGAVWAQDAPTQHPSWKSSNTDPIGAHAHRAVRHAAQGMALPCPFDVQPGLKLPTFSCDNSQRGWWRRKYQQRWLSVSWEVLLHLSAAGSWVGSAGVELHGADVGLCVLFLSISSLPCMCSMHSSAGRALAWLFLLLDLV